MLLINNKGITLVTLVITIIIMLILVGIGVSTGRQSYENGIMNKFVSQMQLIQQNIETISYDEEDPLGVEIPIDKVSQLNNIIDIEDLTGTTIGDWRYFSKATLESDLNLENIDDEIGINFKTKEVISFNGVQYKGNMHYTQYSLPGGIRLIVNDTPISLEFY